MADRLEDARGFRLLNVLDDFNCEGLGIEADLSLLAERGQTLERIIECCGQPLAIGVDNAPEQISDTLLSWVEKRRMAIHHIQPGKPQQNA